MTDQDLEIFQKHMPLYESFKKHSFIRNYSKDVYNDMVRLYSTYVNPKNSFSHWCSSCRAELVVQLYGWFTNEANTTWYRESSKMVAEVEVEIPFTTEQPEISTEPVKRKYTRKKSN